MNNIQEQIKKIADSKTATTVIIIIGILIISFLVFSLGIAVGFHKASFGKDWDDNYAQNFGGGRFNGPMGSNIPNMGMVNYSPNPHGTAGKIIKTEIPNIIVEDKDGTEKTVYIDDDTNIKKGNLSITTNDLMTDDFIITIGSPNKQGVIQAKIIRVIPNPELLK